MPPTTALSQHNIKTTSDIDLRILTFTFFINTIKAQDIRLSYSSGLPLTICLATSLGSSPPDCSFTYLRLSPNSFNRLNYTSHSSKDVQEHLYSQTLASAIHLDYRPPYQVEISRITNYTRFQVNLDLPRSNKELILTKRYQITHIRFTCKLSLKTLDY